MINLCFSKLDETTSEPTAIFDQSLPTHQEVTKIINKINQVAHPVHMTI